MEEQIVLLQNAHKITVKLYALPYIIFGKCVFPRVEESNLFSPSDVTICCDFFFVVVVDVVTSRTSLCLVQQTVTTSIPSQTPWRWVPTGQTEMGGGAIGPSDPPTPPALLPC